MNKHGRAQFALSILSFFVALLLMWPHITKEWWISSDGFYLEAVAHDLLQLHGSWSDWKFSPAPDFFPNMPLYFMAYKLLPDAISRIYFVSVCQALSIAVSCVLLLKALVDRLTWHNTSWIILSTAFFTVASNRDDMFTYLFSSNSHFSALIFTVLGIASLISHVSKITFANTISLILCSVLGASSTKIAFLSFTIPAIVVALIALLPLASERAAIHIPKMAAASILATQFFATAIVTVANHSLTPNDALNRRTVFTLDAAIHSATIMWQTLLSSFTFLQRYRLAFCIVVCICIVYLIFDSLRLTRKSVRISPANQDFESKISLTKWMLFTSAVCVILGSIISGGYVDTGGFRYLSGTIASSITLTVAIAYRNNALSRKFLLTGQWVASTAIVFLCTYYITALASKPLRHSELTDCLVAIEKSGFPLSAGIADYWNAREITAHLPQRNFIMAMTSSRNPLFWMSSLGPVRVPNDYKYFYNFVILRSVDDSIDTHFNAKNIGPDLPPPNRVFTCPVNQESVWLYADDALNGYLKNRFENYLFVERHGPIYSEHGAESRGVIGHPSGQTRLATETVDKAGYLTYGPYLKLETGKYEITVKYAAMQIDSGTHVDAIATVDGKPGVQLFHTAVVQSDNGEIVKTISIGAGGVSDLEIRAFYSGKGTFQIAQTTVKRMLDTQTSK